MKTLLHLRKTSDRYFQTHPLQNFSWLAVSLFLALLAVLILTETMK
jgi:hypothetical protein